MSTLLHLSLFAHYLDMHFFRAFSLLHRNLLELTGLSRNHFPAMLHFQVSFVFLAHRLHSIAQNQVDPAQRYNPLLNIITQNLTFLIVLLLLAPRPPALGLPRVRERRPPAYPVISRA